MESPDATVATPKAYADADLLNVLKKKENMERYLKYVKEYACTGYTMDILKDIPEYYKFYPNEDDIEWPKFQTWFRIIRHPTWKKEKHEIFEMVFANLQKASEVPPSGEVVSHFIRIDFATRIHEECRSVADGRSFTMAGVAGLLEDYERVSGTPLLGTTNSFASTDIKRLLDDMFRASGLEWRLEDLNRALGPLHTGDLVVVVARPEVGKTSFVCSEFTHMVAQLPPGREAVLFNNEERNKLMLRLLCSGSGMSLVDVAMDEAKAIAAYEKNIGGPIDRIKIVEPEGGLHVRDIERVLSRGNFGLIGINVMDKVSGFEGSEQDVHRQRELAKWARNIASKYAPVMAVYQADASAEGQKFLNQSQVYGSKTAIQGEADALVMIGKEPENEDRRFISVPKNKLPGGKRTLPGRRHGKFEVNFDDATGRYTSIEFK